MQINNFNKIVRYIPVIKSDKFMFLQIIRRNKDNKELKFNIHTLYTRFVYTQQELIELMPMIISICESMNARAYINISLKSNNKLQNEVSKKFINNIIDNNYYFEPIKVLSSIAGKLKGENTNKYWLLDLDNCGENALTENQKNHIKEWAIAENIYVDEFPTPNGVHVVVKPFNKLKCYLANLPKFDIHENSAGVILCC